jgi:hypothetical protein
MKTSSSITQLNNYRQDFLQTANITLEDSVRLEHFGSFIFHKGTQKSKNNSKIFTMDFCVIKRSPLGVVFAKSCFDLSSDHSPILITLTADALKQQKERS